MFVPSGRVVDAITCTVCFSTRGVLSIPYSNSAFRKHAVVNNHSNISQANSMSQASKPRHPPGSSSSRTSASAPRVPAAVPRAPASSTRPPDTSSSRAPASSTRTPATSSRPQGPPQTSRSSAPPTETRSRVPAPAAAITAPKVNIFC